MNLTVGKYHLDIDLELTREMYQEMPKISETCSCNNCSNLNDLVDRNFNLFHKDLQVFGIQINKSPEIFEQYRSEDGVSHFMGIFHIVGRIVAGPDCWKVIDSGKQIDEEGLVTFSHGFYGFTREVVLASKAYRHEVFQMEMLLDIPDFRLQDEPNI